MKEVLLLNRDNTDKLEGEEKMLFFLLFLEYSDNFNVISDGRTQKAMSILSCNEHKARTLLNRLREKGAIEFIGYRGLMINPFWICRTAPKYIMEERGRLWKEATSQE